MPQEKSYDIPKSLVWRAYKAVRESRGAAGYDGQTVAQFDENRDRNLYKIWNRLSSGSYLPPPVLKQEIPKADGRIRVLGIPTVADRIAQGAVKLRLEQLLEPRFHLDSYGYRPGRSAHDALEVTRQRVWRYDWVVEVDIKAFFDNVSHERILKALKYHQVPSWVSLYAKRWLEVEMIDRQGVREARERGTPQGGVISPLLANLFLHHGMDEWMQRHYPEIPFARYADDAVLHCRTQSQADKIIRALGARMAEIGLALHPDKTKKVFVGRVKLAQPVATEFTFLGYDFKRRVLRRKDGKLFYRVYPGASKKAMKAMTKTIRSWRIHRSSGMTIKRLAQTYNAILRGWINYYGRFGIVILGIVYGAASSRGWFAGQNAVIASLSGKRNENWTVCESSTQTCSPTGNCWASRKSTQKPYERRRSRTVLCGARGAVPRAYTTQQYCQRCQRQCRALQFD